MLGLVVRFADNLWLIDGVIEVCQLPPPPFFGAMSVNGVDLLKLLDRNSSFTARKKLADEPSVHVGADGSAAENIALHHAVMKKFAEDGGKGAE